MKILHIIPNLTSGGAERFVVDLVNEISKAHNVYLCTLYKLQPGINDFFSSQLSPRVKVFSLNKKKGLNFNTFWKMYDLIREIRPDIIHTHLTSINYILPTALFGRKYKIFHTLHNDAFKETHHRIEFLTRKIYFKYKLILPITISEESKKSYIKAYALDTPPMIYNGRAKPVATNKIDAIREEIKQLKKDPDSLLLLNIGRIATQKNQLMLAKVVDKLIREGHKLNLAIIGSDGYGEESKRIKATIEAVNKNRIFFLGEKDNVFDYLLASDAFCLSSLYEGMPISLLEAMAAGCVPVCTPVGGIAELMNSTQIGILSKDVSEQAFYDALLQLLLNPDIRSMKKKLITEFDKKFDISITSANYLSLYKTTSIKFKYSNI